MHWVWWVSHISFTWWLLAAFVFSHSRNLLCNCVEVLLQNKSERSSQLPRAEWRCMRSFEDRDENDGCAFPLTMQWPLIKSFNKRWRQWEISVSTTDTIKNGNGFRFVRCWRQSVVVWFSKRRNVFGSVWRSSQFDSHSNPRRAVRFSSHRQRVPREIQAIRVLRKHRVRMHERFVPDSLHRHLWRSLSLHFGFHFHSLSDLWSQQGKDGFWVPHSERQTNFALI